MSVLKPNALHMMSAADLIRDLDEKIPHRCIGHDQSIDHARFYAGKRDLIDTLLAQLNRNEDR